MSLIAPLPEERPQSWEVHDLPAEIEYTTTTTRGEVIFVASLPATCLLGDRVSINIAVAAKRQPVQFGTSGGVAAVQAQNVVQLEVSLLLVDGALVLPDDNDRLIGLFLRGDGVATDEFVVVAARPGPAACVLLLYEDGHFSGQASLRTRVIEAPSAELRSEAEPSDHSTAAALELRRPSRPPGRFAELGLLIEIKRHGDFRLNFRAWWRGQWINLGRITLAKRTDEFLASWYKEFDRAASTAPATRLRSFWRKAVDFLTGRPHEQPHQSLFFFETLEAVGDELWAAALPAKFHDFYWDTLRHEKIDSIQLVSDDPWMPWEMLRLPIRWNDDGPDTSNGGKFICQQYALARWLVAPNVTSVPPEGVPWNRLTCFMTSEDLPSKLREWEALTMLPGVDPIKHALTTTLLRQTLKTAQSEGIHVIGHGEQDPDAVETIKLVTDDGAMRPIELSPQQFDLRKSHPLVVLNTCYSGRTGLGLTGVAGWAAAYLRIGASAFVGPLWQINSERAAAFSEKFYQLLASSTPIAEAMKLARDHIFDRNDPTWLSYSLYALADARVLGTGQQLPLRRMGDE